MDHLLDLIDVRGCACTAIAGAGGKTSALFRLARAYDGLAWVSNSAHLAVEQGRHADRVITVNDVEDLRAVLATPFDGVTLFTGPADARGRTRGLDDNTLGALHLAARGKQAPLFVEADGSRMLPLKAPAEWEPPIPRFADAVIVVAGLRGLGKPLSGAWVYRPEVFGALAELDEGATITPSALKKVLSHPSGGLKNIPPEAKKIVLFNQLDECDASFDDLANLAENLLHDYERVVVGSLHGPDGESPAPEVKAVHQRVAGIVLAAGAARRLGRPKQLLDWGGEPLVRRAARIALQAGLDPVVVVTGAYHGQVEAVFEGLTVRIVNNVWWEEGQSTSVRAGIANLDPSVGGAVFLLADQPFVDERLLRALRREHALSRAPVVAPRVGDRRANPILFDRAAFDDLCGLQGDAGGRQVLSRWPVTYLDWPDERIVLDIDDEGDYRRAKENQE